ncbi:TPA: response regulator [Klebsiella aerogenes]|uniref:response regulator n=1 Tax=Klebsiella TaxID=570 RepID=UPI00098343EB|nr:MULTISPECIES: response regulator [Klebsiella]MDU3694325.1 response regulator [Klebsiella michiganensis]AXS53228.1 response regulator [Klebsiella pneumoniae]ELQ9025928.1 response regulator [Klebsiella oxytoca]MBD0763398.1 response regulator [Klebsiella variicola]MBQ5003107.1 response regulator [Klebsiella pneumoniae]
MMQILLIEDEHDKREKIRSQVELILDSRAIIIERESLRGGLKAILTMSDLDLILLDMSMPSFDLTDQFNSEDPESFAGIEIMSQMKLRDINVPVLVVTQYKSFEKGSVTLEDLIEKMSNEFKPFFKGTIYYDSLLEGWKKQLADYLEKPDKV